MPGDGKGSPVTQRDHRGIPALCEHLSEGRPRLRRWIESMDLTDTDVVVDVAAVDQYSAVTQRCLACAEVVEVDGGVADVGEGIGGRVPQLHGGIGEVPRQDLSV